MASSSKDATFSSQNRHTIAYAFLSKKQQTFIKPSLLSLASSHGLDLVPIDPSLPISSQYPRVHLVLHKRYDDLWISNLEDFSSNHPSVPIIDPPDHIRKVQDRISMLKFVSELRIPSNRESDSDLQVQNQYPCTFGVPKQIAVYDESSLADPAVISALSFPVISKPLNADGSSGSHTMALIFKHDGLLKQSPPLVLQEFTNHGGVVFKVYVIGDNVQCVKRSSIPDLSDEMLAEFAQVGSVSFSQISNKTVTQDGPSSMHSEEMEFPPEGFVREVARGLSSALGLHLFNFDMIKDGRAGNCYLVIDINYFPGFEKLPGYEKIVTNFLCSMVHGEQEDGSCSALEDDDVGTKIAAQEKGGESGIRSQEMSLCSFH